MNPAKTLLDPTAETAAVQRPRIARPASMESLTVALLDIAKPRGDEFLDRIEELLQGRCRAVKRYRKPRFSMISSPELRQAIASECQLAIEALAD
jgi:hypothetical protein